MRPAAVWPTMTPMASEVLLYAGSAVLAVWGVMHVKATRNVVRDFGTISADSTHIITMEWIAEGLTHVFVAVLVVLVTTMPARTRLHRTWSTEPAPRCSSRSGC